MKIVNDPTDRLLNLPPQPRVPLAKAIPPARDRWQSLTLTAVVGLLVLYAAVFGVLARGEQPGGGNVALLSLGFALLVAGLRASSPWGALSGGLCCFTITWWTRGLDTPLRHSLLPSLALLVLLTIASTRLGRRRKAAAGLAERGGGRVASQVFANLGAAALLASPLGAYAAMLTGRSLPVETSLLTLAAAAALAEAAADTVSSEIGQALAGRSRTVLITTLRHVPRGTDGGISLPGTLSGAVAAVLVALTATVTLPLRPTDGVIVGVAALLGLLADSLLGATLERGGWIGNDVVNFASTVIAGLAALTLAHALR